MITFQRILASLYTVFGVGFTVYGTSNFLVRPMIDALSSARQSFSETCLTNIQLMNEKLEQAVSKLPVELENEEISSRNRSRSSADLDPAELFHRSIATQTTPETSPLMCSGTFPSLADSSVRAHQNGDLHRLRDQLRELWNSGATPEDSSFSVKSRLNQFQHYLDNLTYGSLLMPKDHLKASKEDEISKIKGEIRGFKGALLSARSFPSGAGLRARGQT